MRKIVVIDDEPEFLELLEIILKGEGYEVVCCENGREALGVIKASSPNLVILDVMLPGMDGCAIATALSQDDATKSIPVMIVTALEHAKPMFEKISQVRAFHPKPLRMAEFIQTVKEAAG